MRLCCHAWIGVPAHAGGVDLSFSHVLLIGVSAVPAHAGGVDLSIQVAELVDPDQVVPAHAGGVDLSHPTVER